MSSNQKTITLQHRLEKARSEIQTSSTWKHYKGGIYRVIDHVILTDDGASIGIKYYRIGGSDFDYSLETGIHFVRPMSEWFDMVEVETHPSFPPEHIPRFTKAVKREIWVGEDE